MRLVSAMADMRSADTPLALMLLLCATAVGAVPARAQTPQPSACVTATGPDVSPVTEDSNAARARQPMRADTSALLDSAPGTNPALRLIASVQAEEVRFARQPKICVRLHGDAQLDSVRIVGRRNIQSPVVVGTTYRNVYVAVEILGHLNAQCIAARITDQPTNGVCVSLELRDSASARPAPVREGGP